MKLFYFELKKLFRFRFIQIFLVVLLVINAVTVLRQTDYISDSASAKDMDRLYQLAAEQPEAIRETYAALLHEKEEQEAWLDDAINAGMSYKEAAALWKQTAPPNQYSTSPSLSDIRLFQSFFREIETIRSYPDTLDTIIGQANRNLQEYSYLDIPEDSYVYQLQTKSIEVYERAKENVQIGFEHSRGWADYFTNHSQILCIGIAVLLFASVLFTEESVSGFLSIMKTARFGRFRTAVVKLLALGAVTAGMVFLYSLETFLIIGGRIGYSSPFNVLQSCPSFALCPYLLTVGEYLLLQFCLRVLFFSVLAVCTAWISVCCYNYIFVYLGGLGFCLLHFLLDCIPYVSLNHPLKMLNFITAVTTHSYFQGYATTNLFHQFTEVLPALLVLYAALLIAFTILVLVQYCRGKTLRSRSMTIMLPLAKLSSLPEKLHRRNEKVHPRRTFPVSVFPYEFFKLFIASRYILLALVLLLVHGYLAVLHYDKDLTFFEAVYRDYMTMYSGPLTDETRENVQAERMYMNRTLGKSDEMQLAYLHGEITKKEYTAYIREYRYAQTRMDVFETIEQHIQYVDAMSRDGKEAWFVYDTGWKAMFSAGFHWELYVLLLVLFTGIFSDEYSSRSSSGGFVQILHSTKNGRWKTWKNKYAWAILTSVSLAILWNAMDFALFVHSYDFPLLHAPVISIEKFQTLPPSMTILQYALCFYSLRILAFVLLSVTLCSLSVLLKKRLAVLVSAVTGTLFPAGAAYFGIHLFEKINFVSYCEATPMLLRNHAVFYTLMLTCICVWTVWRSEKIWNP